MNFYSHIYDGDIDASGNVFENIDCISNTVNKYVLKSSSVSSAEFVQNDIFVFDFN